ncbi:MAG: glycosyltransferase involved in cell wall biosynthesis [Kiritimatiellia bacterium]|jgi:glycosyltransferase involved in cell wall biosynthesis
MHLGDRHLRSVKLLFVTRRLAPDTRSIPAVVFANLYADARINHDVRMVAGYVRGRRFVPQEALGVDLCGRGDLSARATMRRAVRREARRFRPDVVLVNDLSAPISGRPTVCLLHDLSFDAPTPTLRSRLLGQVAAVRGASFDRIVVPSKALATRLDSLGVDARRVLQIAHGVDTERFAPQPIDPDQTITRLLCPGRILPGSGQHIAIDAVARLTSAEKARVQLRVVGPAIDPVYYEQLKVQAWRQPVSFQSNPGDMADAYRDTDMVIYPTLMHEGFADPVTRAMACELPVVWSEQPSLREAMGTFGSPVPPGDVLALREHIRRHLADPLASRATQRGARDAAMRRFDRKKTWRHLERELAKVADQA